MSYSIAQFHSGRLQILIIANTARLKGFVRGRPQFLCISTVLALLKASPFSPTQGYTLR